VSRFAEIHRLSARERLVVRLNWQIQPGSLDVTRTI
jgi:hypothetical protein